MLAHLPPPMPHHRRDAVDQLLMEIHDAIGSFVTQYAGQDRPSGATDPMRERTGPGPETAGADLGVILRGHHVRAGRALLDWSMSDLADAGGLSLSTVRRLEQDAEGVLTRNRRSAAEALREAGIGFLIQSNGAVAVMRLADARPMP